MQSKDHLAVPVSEAPADDIVERLRRQARPVPEGPYRALELDAADTILALRAEVEALREDAERYRWLRAQHWDKASLFVVAGGKSLVRLGTDCPSLDRLDDAIDVARAENAGAPREAARPDEQTGARRER